MPQSGRLSDVDKVRYTVIFISHNLKLSDRIKDIFELLQRVGIVHVESFEQADELIRRSSTSGGTIASIVISRPDDFSRHAAALQRLHPEGGEGLSTVLLSPAITDGDLLQVLTAAVEGHPSEENGNEAIRFAVKTIAQGLSLLPPSIQGRIIKLLSESRELAYGVTSAPPLSAREKEILGWIVAGHSNREIAQSLHLSEGTIKTHVKSILQKTRSANRTQAALNALRLRLIER